MGQAVSVSESEGQRGCETWSGRRHCGMSYPLGRAPGAKLISTMGAPPYADSYRSVRHAMRRSGFISLWMIILMAFWISSSVSVPAGQQAL